MTTIKSESKIVTVSLDQTEVIFVQSYIIYTQYVNAQYILYRAVLVNPHSARVQRTVMCALWYGSIRGRTDSFMSGQM